MYAKEQASSIPLTEFDHLLLFTSSFSRSSFLLVWLYLMSTHLTTLYTQLLYQASQMLSFTLTSFPKELRLFVYVYACQRGEAYSRRFVRLSVRLSHRPTVPCPANNF